MSRLLAASAVLLMFSSVALADGGSISGTITATPAKYLPDTVVFIKTAPGTAKPKTVVMDQKGMKFTPRILTAVVGDTVSFKNSDSVVHNVMSPDQGGYDLGSMKQGDARTKTFDKPGTWVQLCNVHPEMLGYVFVGQNPYMAVVDDKGSFTIDGVPPGSYELAVWNPKLGAASQKVTVAAGAPVQISFALSRGAHADR